MKKSQGAVLLLMYGKVWLRHPALCRVNQHNGPATSPSQGLFPVNQTAPSTAQASGLQVVENGWVK